MFNEVILQIRGHIIALLLEHDCDPTIQFKGRSPMDIAISKSLDIFDIFVKSPKTNLNTVINNSNQNILVKLFVANFCNTLSLTDRLQIVSVVIIIDHRKIVVTVVTLQITNTLFLRY